jgi:hypothetical protein
MTDKEDTKISKEELANMYKVLKKQKKDLDLAKEKIQALESIKATMEESIAEYREEAKRKDAALERLYQERNQYLNLYQQIRSCKDEASQELESLRDLASEHFTLRQ